MSRSIVKSLSPHTVFYSTVNPDGERVEYEICAPPNGGYVSYWSDDGYMQICEGLLPFGPSLYWDGKEPFIDLIRAHHTLRKKNERKK